MSSANRFIDNVSFIFEQKVYFFFALSLLFVIHFRSLPLFLQLYFPFFLFLFAYLFAHLYSREYRENLKPGSKNIIHQNLVDKSKIFLPPLHIKLGLMKQFVKALNKDGKCFKYLCTKFVHLSDAKLKEGIFVGPQIRQLVRDKEFEETMTPEEKQAWIGFKNVVDGFLGNTKSPNYKTLVSNMLQAYRKLGCNMSVKVHFLFNHLDFFPKVNLGSISDEQGERFHQDIQEMERRYQGRWNTCLQITVGA